MKKLKVFLEEDDRAFELLEPYMFHKCTCEDPPMLTGWIFNLDGKGFVRFCDGCKGYVSEVKNERY